MEIKKKIIKWTAFAMLGVTLISSAAFAGNSYFSFNVANTGKVITTCTSSANKKATSGAPWVVRTSTLSFTDTTYQTKSLGMAFTTTKLTGSSYTKVGGNVWMLSPSRSTGTWNYNQGTVNTTYYLAARLDDVLAGTGKATGYWNADAY